MSCLRVAFVDHTALMSGGERSLLEITSRATKFDPFVILGANGPLARALEVGGVGYTIVPLSTSTTGVRTVPAVRRAAELVWALPRWGAAIERVLAPRRPDVVVANTQRAGLAATLAARRLGLPLLWAVRDRISPDYFGRVEYLLARLALSRGPDLVVANSAATAATCPTRAATTVIAPSVSPFGITAAEQGSPTHFAMVARLAPWKGQDLVVRAFAEAFPSGPERLSLVGGALFGEVEFERSLRGLVTELGLAGRVILTGHVDDVAAELAGVDVLVHATRIPEPFGRSIVEAMGAGLPVIVEAAGGPAEIVMDRHDGLVVPHGDASALKDAMIEMSSNPLLRERLGENAVISARRYAPEVIEPAWVNALERTVELHRGRRR